MTNQEMRTALKQSFIPERMQEGLLRYIFHGVIPGSFLTAVLKNDLSGAVANGDEENISCLRDYVVFLYNCAPMACWGSEEAVHNWEGLLTPQKKITNKKG